MKRFACLFSVVWLVSCSRQPAAPEKEATPVRLTAVTRYAAGEGQVYSASILPNRQVTLAFRTSGFVESIHQVRGADGRMRSVDIGDVVPLGTTLAQVRTKDYQLQVSQIQGQVTQAQEAEQAARAQLAQAEAAAVKAQQDFDRADALFKKTSLTKSDYDAARANRDATQAQVNAARAQAQGSAGTLNAAQSALGTANLGLSDTSLAAPFTGAVLQRSIDVGTLAGPGVPAFVIADISSVKAAIAVPDIAVTHLRKGSPIAIYAEPFPGRKFKGFVSAIAAAADSTTRSFQVEVTVPNDHALLRAGMVVSLALTEAPPSEPVNVVPLSAIVRAGPASSQFAVVVVSDGKAQHEPVTLGDTYGDRIAIKGVDAGQMVVISGASFVSDGEAVKVLP
ncbi:MAG TPA: efflux RND transporter periplasmic adaptor subunit [Bryobacteraceae bacterium]|nr:efflux RND transporter periplasmic adaptor subunit [Bryobacteraceae bacterium]